MLNRKKRPRKSKRRSTMLRQRYVRAMANFQRSPLEGYERRQFKEAAIRAHALWLRSV